MVSICNHLFLLKLVPKLSFVLDMLTLLHRQFPFNVKRKNKKKIYHRFSRLSNLTRRNSGAVCTAEPETQTHHHKMK